MRKRPLVLVLAASIVGGGSACGADTASPAQSADGVWVLATYNGQAIPTPGLIIQADTLTIRGDSSSSVTILQSGTQRERFTSSGRVVRLGGDSVRVEEREATGVVAGSQLRLVDAASRVFVYRRL